MKRFRRHYWKLLTALALQMLTSSSSFSVYRIFIHTVFLDKNTSYNQFHHKSVFSWVASVNWKQKRSSFFVFNHKPQHEKYNSYSLHTGSETAMSEEAVKIAVVGCENFPTIDGWKKWWTQTCKLTVSFYFVQKWKALHPTEPNRSSHPKGRASEKLYHAVGAETETVCNRVAQVEISFLKTSCFNGAWQVEK